MTNKQVIDLAKQKAAMLSTDTQQRIFGGEAEKSLWVYNIKGLAYIGHPKEEGFNKDYKILPNRTNEMLDRNNQYIGSVQKLLL